MSHLLGKVMCYERRGVPDMSMLSLRPEVLHKPYSLI
ncbi:unnamed protein product [Acanthoscelides obtectus]|uniref:Uncharacterized protein n=1 Tax=Acanthoscelides obtectus TaxID=200917 RepID=A0A9P0PPW1_ACAOB|nr:unnamed protein product [Acanthoscelides obtectus]CAK1655271.1 hypothetical protein AOBTE_LOCUS19118 [Acanthoscelides obtectus]